MVIVLIIVGLLVLIGVIYVLVRNSIIAERNRVDEAWSGIDVQLKRRHDLVPNLVESVKGYATHERATFEKVTQARAAAMQASGPAEAAGGIMLSQALGGLRVVAEQYPDLRATENFQQLQRQLSELEDEIQASRRIYNSNVRTTTRRSSSSRCRSSRSRAASPTSRSSRSATPRNARLRRSPSPRSGRSLVPLEPKPPPPRIDESSDSASRARRRDRDEQELGDPIAWLGVEIDRTVGVEQHDPHLAPVAGSISPGS